MNDGCVMVDTVNLILMFTDISVLTVKDMRSGLFHLRMGAPWPNLDSSDLPLQALRASVSNGHIQNEL